MRVYGIRTMTTPSPHPPSSVRYRFPSRLLQPRTELPVEGLSYNEKQDIRVSRSAPVAEANSQANRVEKLRLPSSTQLLLMELRL